MCNNRTKDLKSTQKIIKGYQIKHSNIHLIHMQKAQISKHMQTATQSYPQTDKSTSRKNTYKTNKQDHNEYPTNNFKQQ